MTKLSVNINKIATLRNSRGGNLPNLIKIAKDCEKFGAHGITVHPRPDARHITYDDVKALKKIVTGEFNIEGYPSENFINLILEILPDQVTLVPDPPEALTSDQGWDTEKNYPFLKKIIPRFQDSNIRVSLFMDTNLHSINIAKELNTNRIEFYTGTYAKKFSPDTINKAKAILKYREAANHATNLGLELNAGHDLNLENLGYFVQQIPLIKEVSIGHALICDTLYYGLEKTINLYLSALKN